MTDKVSDNRLKIKTWKSKGKRAPHKPLLLLWAIGQCLQGQPRLSDFRHVHEELTSLWERFGGPGNVRTQFPFWRLQNDGLWDIPRAASVSVNSSGDVSPEQLRELDIRGGLTKELFDHFRGNPSAALDACFQLVEDHFTPTLAIPVLEATLGSDVLMPHGDALEPAPISVHRLVETQQIRRYRAPQFRNSVLQAYGHGCAVCDFSIEFPQGTWPALQAAHIRWHSHDGPDDIRNGLSLCVMHHELFDRGIFTITGQTKGLKVVVAERLLESGPSAQLSEFHEQPLARTPWTRSEQPARTSLEWHNENVFQGKL